MEKPMNTRVLSTVLFPALLAISLSVSAQNPKETTKPADEAQMRKQCEDMKNMDMSKMSAAEHEAMMKRCQEMMDKDKNKQKPKEDRKY